MFFCFTGKPWSEGLKSACSLLVDSHTSVMSQSEFCVNVWDWLCVIRLEQYSEAFQNAGLATLQQCRSLTPDQLDQMGITLPGHQRRILASLSKTHGNCDTHSDPHCHREKAQRSEGKSHTQVLQRETLHPSPVEDRPAPKQNDGEVMKPIPRERERPIPRERQVSRIKEEGAEEPGENKSVPEQRQMAPRLVNEEETNGGVDGIKEKPLPKQRTKFRPSAPVDCPPTHLVSSPSDTYLPPVPPRSSPNCPPQRFTSPLSPSPSPRAPGHPMPDGYVAKAPTAQRRSVTTLLPTTTSTHTPTQIRPQTLAIQPHAISLGRDSGRKISPIITTAPTSDRNLPPLPPKVGVGGKGPLPIPQSPSTHRWVRISFVTCLLQVLRMHPCHLEDKMENCRCIVNRMFIGALQTFPDIKNRHSETERPKQVDWGSGPTVTLSIFLNEKICEQDLLILDQWPYQFDLYGLMWSVLWLYPTCSALSSFL